MAQTEPHIDTYTIPVQPNIRKISLADLKDVLAKGWDDFTSMPTFAIFLVVIYPILGVIIFSATFRYNLLPLIFPLVAGFALLGPLAAVGLYEMSRQRERNIDISLNLLNFLRSPAIGAILTLGIVLLVIFTLWLGAAQAIYNGIFDAPVRTLSVEEFIAQILGTSEGWALIVVGCGVGFVFALVTFVISVISFPMILDRNVSALTAVATSIKAVAVNPLPMTIWGLIVAGALIVGSLPFFVGLIVVLPVLGHSTWHLYTKLIDR
jgi:uncharacterized membrane protein